MVHYSNRRLGSSTYLTVLAVANWLSVREVSCPHFNDMIPLLLVWFSLYLSLIKKNKRISQLWKSLQSLLWKSISCEQFFLCAHSHAKYVFFPTHIFPPPSYFFVFPCRYFWDFKTQILKHLHENTSCTLCADIFNTYTVNYKCKCIQSNIISNYVVQSVFTWRDSSVWSLGYHGSIMFSVSLSYSFYVKMISD